MPVRQVFARLRVNAGMNIMLTAPSRFSADANRLIDPLSGLNFGDSVAF